MNRGNITLGAGMVMSIVVAVTSTTAAYFSAQMATASRISQVELSSQQAIAAVDNRVTQNSADISNIKPALDSLTNKVDAILIHDGLDPNKVK